MKKSKFIFLLVSIFVAVFAISLLTIRYLSVSQNSEISDEAKITKELLSRIENQTDINEPLGVFDEYGNELTQTDVTILDKDQEVTVVTKYEILKDVYGNDVKVKLKKQHTVEKNGNEYDGWVIDEESEGTIKFYVGEIKEVNEEEIIFKVSKETDLKDVNTESLTYKNADGYLKFINLEDYTVQKNIVPFVPPNDIFVGFKKYESIDDLKDYMGETLCLQESIIYYYKNSPCCKTLTFRKYK